ncbi:MAG: hypothetical protein K0A98_09170 [Trueperaceae bacterium]|nr:hypothetical protein [Trueperaceae bacterium]
MLQGRRWFLVALLAVSGLGLGQTEAACPELPGDDRTYGGEPFVIGGWTLVAGAWLATCADGSALWVACSGEGDALEMRLVFPTLDAPTYTVSFADAVSGILTTGPLGPGDGGLVLGEVGAGRLIAVLTAGDALRVTLTPDGDEAAARDVVFATAGFEEALPWLGCGDADACPARSCGP